VNGILTNSRRALSLESLRAKCKPGAPSGANTLANGGCLVKRATRCGPIANRCLEPCVQDDSSEKSGDERPANREDVGFADAAAVAKELIGRLADNLEIRESDASSKIALLEAQRVLSRLAQGSPAPAKEPVGNPASTIVLDVSDLIGYFEHNRLPTGIQRVQSELIFNLLKSLDSDAVRLCCFVEARNQWVKVDSAQFVDICVQSRAGGDPLDPRWLGPIYDLRAAINASPAMAFPRGAVLMNVGTSWWLPNYFLYVREAKIASDVRYVPLIYDLIPALTPENCDPKLVREFIGWFVSVLDHADFYLAISEATRNDLLDFAAKLGRPISPDRIAVAPLNADFRPAESQALPPTRRFPEPFVLFVSTLEARKNQLGALDAWATLIDRHGLDKVPRLVLVGKRGFQADLIFDRLKSSADLRQRVTILSGIEDLELQALYRDCLFTIYPSFYEGWGLPVTESLCYGKVPLIADNSSLPESGGSSALYFKTGSTAAMIAELERLIFEAGFREQREKIVRSDFRPRNWADVTSGVADRIREWAVTTPLPEWQAPVAQPGAYYPLVRNQSMRVWPGMGSAEQFRRGLGWHKLEDDGCWMIPSGAELELRLSSPDIHRLGLELFCSQRAETHYRIELAGHDLAVEGRLTGRRARWAFLELPEGIADTALRIRITATTLTGSEQEQEEQDLDQESGSKPAVRRAVEIQRQGAALRGFFLFGNDPRSRMDFVEAAALGALPDLDFYRDRSLAAIVG
jgi:glycosyltransferase involved in cell wall biosynthesis